MTFRHILLALAILCFAGVAIFAPDMHHPDEALRFLAAGLAFFAGSHFP